MYSQRNCHVAMYYDVIRFWCLSLGAVLQQLNNVGIFVLHY